MTCRRCGGLLIPTVFAEDIGLLDVERCVNCGNIEDAQILEYRTHRPEPRPDPQLPVWDPDRHRLRVIQQVNLSTEFDRLEDRLRELFAD